MEAEGDDSGLLDPEMLRLKDASPFRLKAYAYAIEQLFPQWLSLPDTLRLVKSLIARAKSGASLNVTGNSTINIATSSYSQPSMFPSGSTPPVSFIQQRVGSSLLTYPHKLVKNPKREAEAIPQFYFIGGPPPSNDMKQSFLSKVNQFFPSHLDGLKINELKSVTKNICKLPSFLSSSLFRKIDINSNGNVSREQFINFWTLSNMLTMDLATQVYTILKGPDRNYLVQDDFKPALQELLETHPGLDFLQSTPKAQELYAATVIYRIFYYINRSGNGRLTLRELKRGNLIAAMQHVDEENNINQVLKYFSYEHYYVIHCIFRKLINDNDHFIRKEDLLKYGDHGLNYCVVDRIFSEIPRKFTCEVKGIMDYEDFVYFILAEEDKSSEPSLEYWFKCIDLDENGVLTKKELQFFCEEQLRLMKWKPEEPILYENILDQIFDMIGPQNDSYITLRDIKSCKLSGIVFSILTNLHKFTAFVRNSPYFIHQVSRDSILTDWERFALIEYIRLATEEFEDVEDLSDESF